MQIDEAVSKGQLRNLVDAIVSIDQYKSKIDEDRNMVVLAFEVMNEMAAGDLSNFIETGAYDVEDTEVSASTNVDGNYMIYVEMRRGSKLHETIRKILEDVSKLTEIESWQYNTGKNGIPQSIDNLEEMIINDPVRYQSVQEADANQKALEDRMRFLARY
tara:strand:+ start:11014 stop:11493 length:480 start_codon:yes stop_codon:yes gene_type:complete